MIKILHTADWHIGKVLHLYELEADHKLFFNWMIELIRKEEIDVLIVAGDVFDQNNPPNEARKLYYELLKDLAQLSIQVIIVGGNHDSINMLHASKELLGLLGITVIAGVPEEFEDQIIPLINKAGIIGAVCAAVPYLRDKDLRAYIAGESTESRIQATKSGILEHYKKCRSLIETKYSNQYPSIATGHLYIQGATLSDSERDIQIGNQAGIDAASLTGMFDYIALGHIHIANRYGNGQMRYCGSPIPLSFSEKEDEKKVIIVEIDNNTLTSRSVNVPKFRSLLKLQGSWLEIKEKIEMLNTEALLPPLLELEIYEPIAMIASIEYEISTYKANGVNIVKRRFVAEQHGQPLSQMLPDKSITELNPREVFLKKLEGHVMNEEDVKTLVDAYAQLLEEVQSSESI